MEESQEQLKEKTTLSYHCYRKPKLVTQMTESQEQQEDKTTLSYHWYRKPKWITKVKESQEHLKDKKTSSYVAVSSVFMPKHGSDNDVKSIDSLDNGSMCQANNRTALSREINGAGIYRTSSVISLGDASIGDDSVFVSSNSPCSDDLHAAAETHLQLATCSSALKSYHHEMPVTFQSSLYVTAESLQSKQSSVINNTLRSDFANLTITPYLHPIKKRRTNNGKIDIFYTENIMKQQLVTLEPVLKMKSNDTLPVTQISENHQNEMCVELGDHDEELDDVRKSVVIEQEGPTFHLCECKEESKEVMEIVDISEDQKSSDHSAFIFLPDQVNSAPSTTSSYYDGSNSDDIKQVGQEDDSEIKLLSVSCENLSRPSDKFSSVTQTKYHTFPRTKFPRLSPLRNNSCYYAPKDPTMSTTSPLEPRELDPAGFNQLHTADSQEELQEFFLLESQCMTTEGHGLAAAFLPSDEDHFHSDEEDSQNTISDFSTM